MSDSHIRLLTAAARHSERQLDAHEDEVRDSPDEGTVARRFQLARRASRMRDRVTAARERRRERAPEGDSP